MGSIQDLTSDVEDLEVIIKHPTTGLDKRALKAEFETLNTAVNQQRAQIDNGFRQCALKTEVAKYEVAFSCMKWRLDKH